MHKTRNHIGKLTAYKKESPNELPFHIVKIELQPELLESPIFKVRMEKSTDTTFECVKTKISRTYEKRTHTNGPTNLGYLSEFFDESDIVCSKFLCELFFCYRFRFGTIDIVLPPRLECFEDRQYKSDVNRLEVKVLEDETDTGLINWWLSKFENKTDVLKITAKRNKMEIAYNLMLKMTDRVEVSGNTDINVNTFIEYKGNCFFYKNIPRNWSLTDEDVEQLCIALNEHSGSKRIFLSWGDPLKARRFKEFLKQKYPDFMMETPHFLRKNELLYFYFKMTEGRTVLGNFCTLDFVNATELDRVGNEL
ncbi:unnamed protein product [Caenorhabditis angaria]|uniref:Uncharacterized protein n=1 Tax=Caenorhabditis angaria TaxID=860376 RepID=A0A9P1MVT8_9PELO|nr:unnamed protein product [Caenorhabditis angaria]